MTEAISNKYEQQLKAFEEFGLSTSSFSQFGGAELLAKKYSISREARFSGFESSERAFGSRF